MKILNTVGAVLALAAVTIFIIAGVFAPAFLTVLWFGPWGWLFAAPWICFWISVIAGGGFRVKVTDDTTDTDTNTDQ